MKKTPKVEIKNAGESFKRGVSGIGELGKGAVKAVGNTAAGLYQTVNAADLYIDSKFKTPKSKLMHGLRKNMLKLLIGGSILVYTGNGVMKNREKHKKIPGIEQTDDGVWSGIDISQNNSEFDLKTLLETNVEKINDSRDDTRPFKFIILRASMSKKLDKRFKEFWHTITEHNDTCQIDQNKFIIGAYHYYNPDLPSKEQFDTFKKQVPVLSSGNLAPILDIERLPSKQSLERLKQGLKNRLDLAEETYGVKPVIYTGQSFYDDYLRNDPRFAGYALWVAHYNGDESKIEDPEYTIHQISEDGNVPGANTDQETCDINNAYAQRLKNLIIQK